jgi:hypothetical protein
MKLKRERETLKDTLVDSHGNMVDTLEKAIKKEGVITRVT